MHNWSTNISQLKKKPEQYKIWKLEQLVNFGLNKEKISASDIIKYWDDLNVDPARKKFLRLIIWPSKGS